MYCTGRSVRGNLSPYGRPETIDETADIIKAEGGTAIAVRVDHSVESEVESFFARIDREHGRLDVLVNSIAGEEPMMAQWNSFWKTNLTDGEAVFRQALLSHIITAKHAAPLMIRRRRGLIVEVTENDILMAGGNPLSQTVKLALKGLAFNMAAELKPHGVAAIAITPGFLRSEAMLERFGVSEANWRDAGKQDKNFLESESPLFVGRAVAALAQDGRVLERSGQLYGSWELGREYGFTDADGRRPDWGSIEIDFSGLPPALARVDENWLRDPARMAESVVETNEAVSGAATAGDVGFAQTYCADELTNRIEAGCLSSGCTRRRPRPKRAARSNRKRPQQVSRVLNDKSLMPTRCRVTINCHPQRPNMGGLHDELRRRREACIERL